jgi:hypothetical protein
LTGCRKENRVSEHPPQPEAKRGSRTAPGHVNDTFPAR